MFDKVEDSIRNKKKLSKKQLEYVNASFPKKLVQKIHLYQTKIGGQNQFKFGVQPGTSHQFTFGVQPGTPPPSQPGTPSKSFAQAMRGMIGRNTKSLMVANQNNLKKMTLPEELIECNNKLRQCKSIDDIKYVFNNKGQGTYGTIYPLDCNECGIFIKYFINQTDFNEINEKLNSLITYIESNKLIELTTFAKYKNNILFSNGYFLREMQSDLKECFKFEEESKIINYIVNAKDILDKFNSINIVHGDIKFDNIMIKQDKSYLHDFDGAQIITEDNPLPELQISIIYASPLTYCIVQKYDINNYAYTYNIQYDQIVRNLPEIIKSFHINHNIANIQEQFCNLYECIMRNHSDTNLYELYKNSDYYSLGMSCILYGIIYNYKKIIELGKSYIDYYFTKSDLPKVIWPRFQNVQQPGTPENRNIRRQGPRWNEHNGRNRPYEGPRLDEGYEGYGVSGYNP
jgi:hypothetical protein